MGSEYALGYELLSVCSLEDRHIPATVEQCMSLGGRLLDIGCADGRITAAIAEHFEEVDVIEPNPLLYSLAMSRLRNGSYRLRGANDTLDPYSGPYELILASHMLYHVAIEGWASFFSNMARQLDTAGEIAVILWDRDSEARQLTLDKAPHRWLCCTEDLYERLEQIGKCGLRLRGTHRFIPVIQPSTLMAARLILRFLLGRASHNSSDEDLDALEQRMLKHVLSNQQTLAVFSLT
jgi:SAM-dependent methyltransferase